MHNNHTIKAVFFDLDDTLYDHSYSVRVGLQSVRQQYPYLQDYTIDELFATYLRLLDEVHLHVLNGSMTIDEARINRFQRFFLTYNPDMPNLAEVVEHASTLHRSVYLANRQLVAGAGPILEYMHGKVKIAVVTNNIVTKQVDKLQTLQIEHLVDELV